jgi:hypothetical protein
MMARANGDYKTLTSKDEGNRRPDAGVVADLWKRTTEQKTKRGETPLDVSASLVVATLLAQQDLEYHWINGCKTPIEVIESQIEFIASRQAMNHMAQAAKFGLKIPKEKLTLAIAGNQQERINFIAQECQSAVDNGLERMEYQELVGYITDNYPLKDQWKQALIDSCARLYDQAVKRLNEGQYADLEEEVISIALENKAKLEEQRNRLNLVA